MIIYVFVKETDPGPLPTSKMESFATIFDDLKLDFTKLKKNVRIFLGPRHVSSP